MSRPARLLLARLLPDTVVGRTAAVLVAALALSLGLAVALFSVARHEALSALGGRFAAEQVGGLVRLVEETPQENRRQALANLDTPRFHVGWGARPIVVDTETEGLAAALRPSLEKAVEGRELRISTAPPRVFGGPGGNHAYGLRNHGPPPHEFRALRIAVRLQDDTWLNVLAPLDHHGDSLWRPRFVLPLLMALLLVTVVALLAVRRAARPFATFAAAAERLGVDVGAPPMAESGPREVRRAASAFNLMQERIRRFVEDRTQMLAAISHDLRTPITRLRLRAEFVDDDEQRSKMLADLEEMEAMIAATLAFARDDAAREPRCKLDVAALLQGLVDDLAATGAEAAYDGPETLVMQARPSGLKRALANLLDNAVKYGSRARVRLAAGPSEAAIEIEDDGPGIAAADRERVFAPFVRLEASRSRDTGGTGLGLAVARAAIRAHGGDITLGDGPRGGLKVVVTLPRH